MVVWSLKTQVPKIEVLKIHKGMGFLGFFLMLASPKNLLSRAVANLLSKSFAA